MNSLPETSRGPSKVTLRLRLPLVCFWFCCWSVMTVVPVTGGTQCYVCSWQKPTGKLEMVDNCSHFHFREEAASTVSDCEFGCEAITYRKSKNEEIYQFTRNCLTRRPGLASGEDKCYNVDEKTEHQSICECHSNLCNDATTPMTTTTFTRLMSFAIFYLISTFSTA